MKFKLTESKAQKYAKETVLSIDECEEVNPFRGFYDNFKPRKRENEFAYTRKDWMLLLSECERVLVQERQSKRQLLLTRSAL